VISGEGRSVLAQPSKANGSRAATTDTGNGVATQTRGGAIAARVDGAAERVLTALLATPTWLQALGALLLVSFYAQRIWTVYTDTGLFRRLGFDWGLFYSQASAFAAGDIGAMYQVDRLNPYLQRLVPFTSTPDVPLLQWPSPYPPVLAALMAPLTFMPPPAAFGIWTALSFGAAVHLLWRANQLLSGRTSPVGGGAGAIRGDQRAGARIGALALIFFTTLPVLQTFLLGQPVLFLASAMAEAFLAVRRGADFRGGLWLGLLALKPQYGLVLGLFLLWKRRWWAVAGAALTVGLVIGASALVAGPSAVWDYQAAVSAMSSFRDPYAVPGEMVNWRAVIVNARPAIGNTSGVLLFLALSAATILAVVAFTRDKWVPKGAKLDLQLGAVITATFLVSYHSHMHGLVLLTVPLAAMWRSAIATPLLKLSLVGLVFLPTAVFVAVAAVGRGFAINYDDPLWVVWPVLTAALLVVLLGSILVALARQP
jgi:hypothetical protein